VVLEAPVVWVAAVVLVTPVVAAEAELAAPPVPSAPDVVVSVAAEVVLVAPSPPGVGADTELPQPATTRASTVRQYKGRTANSGSLNGSVIILSSAY
jgi:hypothetical protein